MGQINKAFNQDVVFKTYQRIKASNMMITKKKIKTNLASEILCFEITTSIDKTKLETSIDHSH